MAKKTRKELLKQEDVFLTSVDHAATWLQRNRKQVVAAALGVIVVVASVWSFVVYRADRVQDASRLLTEAQQLVRAEVIVDVDVEGEGEGEVVVEGEGEAGRADPAASPPTFASSEARARAALEKFERAAEAAGGSGVGLLARFYVAGLNEELGQTGAARELFDKLLKELSPSDRLYFLAAERAAYIREAAGDHDGAMVALKPLLPGEGSQKSFFGDFATFHVARIHEARGDQVHARELYETLQNDFPTSSLLPEVEQRLRELGPAPPKEVAEASASAATAAEKQPAAAIDTEKALK